MAENGGMMDFISKALSDPQTVSKLQDVISMFAGPAQQTTQQPSPQYPQYTPYPPQYNPYQAPPQYPPYQPTYQTSPTPQAGYAYPDFLQQQGYEQPVQDNTTDATHDSETAIEPEPHHMTHLNSILKNLPANNPQRINLLTAIKPFLNTKRADKLDKAIQLLKNTNMANMFKGR